MSLSTEEYLNLVDQMTKLRLENQKYQQENSKIVNAVEKEKSKVRELSQSKSNVQTSSFGIKTQPEEKYRPSRNTSDYLEELKSSVGSMQKDICQFITMTSEQQMAYLKEEVKFIRKEIKAMSQSLEQNKQNVVKTNQRNQKEFTELSKENSNKEIKECLKDLQVDQICQKIKAVYSLCNKDKKDPTTEELCSWLANFNTETQPVQQFNPIQAIKKARSTKKLLEKQLVSNDQTNELIKKPIRKQAKTKIKDETDRNIVQKYIQHYEKEKKKREDENAQMKSTKSFLQASVDYSVLPPKIKSEEKHLKPERNLKSEIKKDDKPKLKKKTILQKSLMTNSGDLKPIREEDGKKTKSESKTKAKAQSSNKSIAIKEKQKTESKKTIDQTKTSKKKKAEDQKQRKSLKSLKLQGSKKKIKDNGNQQKESKGLKKDGSTKKLEEKKPQKPKRKQSKDFLNFLPSPLPKSVPKKSSSVKKLKQK